MKQQLIAHNKPFEISFDTEWMVITNYKIFTQFNLRNCYDQDTIKKKSQNYSRKATEKCAKATWNHIFVATPNIFYKLITNNEKYVDKVNFLKKLL